MVGSGDVVPQLQNYVKEENLDAKVFFMGKQPLEILYAFTELADLGVSMDKDTNLNYRYSLPNKLFDYIQFGVPVYSNRYITL